MTGLYDIPIQAMDGQTTTLAPYQGQVLLIVNVASRCGFSKQYADLESLHQDYSEHGFSVLGFPCNQFFQQEPGSHADIKQFAESCFNVSFPMFAKIHVKGQEQAPIYQYLAKNIGKKPWTFVPWNFTKILISREGHVLKRFLPTTSFKIIRRDIEELLAKK